MSTEGNNAYGPSKKTESRLAWSTDTLSVQGNTLTLKRRRRSKLVRVRSEKLVDLLGPGVI